MSVLQGNIIKQVLGLNRRSRSSPLFKALGIPNISDAIQNRQTDLLRRIFKIETSCSKFYRSLLSQFILTGNVCRKTLLGRVIASGISPIDVIFGEIKGKRGPVAQDGLVDSLRTLLLSTSYNSGGAELALARLLLRSF